MKVRSIREGLGLVAVIAAILAKDTLVKITGDNTVDKAGSGDHSIGRLSVPSRTAGGKGTVESRYKEYIEIKTVAALTAGQFFKFGAPDGTTGENTAALWILGTDAESLKAGIIWKGAASGGVAEALTL